MRKPKGQGKGKGKGPPEVIGKGKHGKEKGKTLEFFPRGQQGREPCGLAMLGLGSFALPCYACSLIMTIVPVSWVSRVVVSDLSIKNGALWTPSHVWQRRLTAFLEGFLVDL